ncbi:hypothetical protein [Peribacillus loiseleuriae]|nr:hypothetical protein [Peribacillus loiseleuriae]
MQMDTKRLTDFFQEDRFELNSYLTYMFNQFDDYAPKPLEDQMIK